MNYKEEMKAIIDKVYKAGYNAGFKKGVKTKFDNSVDEKIKAEIKRNSELFINKDGEDCLAIYEDDVIEIIDKYANMKEE